MVHISGDIGNKTFNQARNQANITNGHNSAIATKVSSQQGGINFKGSIGSRLQNQASYAYS